jgi:hypothetical protein
MDMSSRDDHHKHGSLGGHALPGIFFVAWGTWWFASICSIYIHRTQRRKAWVSRPHYRLPLAASVHLEPLAKIILPFIGILGELYFSHHAKWRCATARFIPRRALRFSPLSHATQCSGAERALPLARRTADITLPGIKARAALGVFSERPGRVQDAVRRRRQVRGWPHEQLAACDDVCCVHAQRLCRPHRPPPGAAVRDGAGGALRSVNLATQDCVAFLPSTFRCFLLLMLQGFTDICMFAPATDAACNCVAATLPTICRAGCDCAHCVALCICRDS